MITLLCEHPHVIGITPQSQHFTFETYISESNRTGINDAINGDWREPIEFDPLSVITICEPGMRVKFYMTNVELSHEFGGWSKLKISVLAVPKPIQ